MSLYVYVCGCVCGCVFGCVCGCVCALAVWCEGWRSDAGSRCAGERCSALHLGRCCGLRFGELLRGFSSDVSHGKLAKGLDRFCNMRPSQLRHGTEYRSAAQVLPAFASLLKPSHHERAQARKYRKVDATLRCPALPRPAARFTAVTLGGY